jgi:hypothetical protein
MSGPAPRQATWDDLLDVDDDHVGEIVGGQLRVTPRPDAPHAETTSDPVACTLEVYRREAAGYLLMVSAHGVARLRVPPFDAIELELELLWGDRFDPNAARRQEE